MTYTSTPIRRHGKAPRGQVYRALLAAYAVAGWTVLTGLAGRVHEFDAREVIPRGHSPTDNETGWRMTRDKRAAFVEAGGDA